MGRGIERERVRGGSEGGIKRERTMLEDGRCVGDECKGKCLFRVSTQSQKGKTIKTGERERERERER